MRVDGVQMNESCTHQQHHCKYQRDHGESLTKRLTHSHWGSTTAFDLPAPPCPHLLSKMSPGSQHPETSSEGCAKVLTTSPNAAWQPLINKLLEALGSWINAKKQHPEEIRTEILQSRKPQREKWHRQCVRASEQLRPGLATPVNVNRVTSNVLKTLNIAKVTMNATV